MIGDAWAVTIRVNGSTCDLVRSDWPFGHNVVIAAGLSPENATHIKEAIEETFKHGWRAGLVAAQAALGKTKWENRQP